jgi:hypothetical protein
VLSLAVCSAEHLLAAQAAQQPARLSAEQLVRLLAPRPSDATAITGGKVTVTIVIRQATMHRSRPVIVLDRVASGRNERSRPPGGLCARAQTCGVLLGPLTSA